MIARNCEQQKEPPVQWIGGCGLFPHFTAFAAAMIDDGRPPVLLNAPVIPPYIRNVMVLGIVHLVTHEALGAGGRCCLNDDLTEGGFNVSDTVSWHDDKKRGRKQEEHGREGSTPPAIRIAGSRMGAVE